MSTGASLALETGGQARVWAWRMRSSAWAQKRGPAPVPQEICAPRGPRFSPLVSSVNLHLSSRTPPATWISNRSPLPFHLQMSLIPGHSQPPGGSGRPLHLSLPVLDQEGRLVLLLLPGARIPLSQPTSAPSAGDRLVQGDTVARRYQDATPCPPANFSIPFSLFPKSCFSPFIHSTSTQARALSAFSFSSFISPPP